MTEPTTLSGVAHWVWSDPWGALGRRWNHKSAVLSAGTRGLLFFVVNLPGGMPSAAAALGVECALRLGTSGFFGALTQAFRRVEPERTGTIAAMLILPCAGHSLELLTHWSAGTGRLAASIAVSVLFTALSTAFHLFAMRRGVLVTGVGSGSLLSDLRAMPGLLLAFASAALRTASSMSARALVR